MPQNREPPAYQEYAATILAQLHFRKMSLQDRGLFFTMRLECWVNLRLPQNHTELAKVLGLPISEVAESLASVMFFFKIVDGFIICPELENYRTHLADRRIKQSQGGKLGSKITNTKRKQKETTEPDGSATPSSNSQHTRQGKVESLVQLNAENQSQNQYSGRERKTDPFVAEYEEAEKNSAEAYAKASNGE